MNETITVDDTTRIRHIDGLNWTVEVLKERESRKDGSKYSKWVQANGEKYGPFLRGPADAAVWLLDRRFGDSGFRGSLAQSVDEYRRIAVELRAAIERAVGWCSRWAEFFEQDDERCE